MARLLLFAGLILISTALTAGKMYRWVDEHGVTQYTQIPPPKGDATEVKPPPPPAVDPADAQGALDTKRQQLEDRREDRDIKKQEAQQSKEEQKLHEKNCQAARNNLKKLQANPRGRWKQKDGQSLRYTQEQHNEKVKEAQEQIKAFCK